MKDLTNETIKNVHYSTLVDIIRSRALEQPGKQAFTFLVDGEKEEVSLTYKELDEQARAIAALIQSTGKTGDRALLLYPPGVEFITAYMGCFYSGVIAVPIYPPHPARLEQSWPRVTAIINDAKPALVLTTPGILDRVNALFSQPNEQKTVSWLATGKLDPDLANHWQNPGINGGNLAFLQYTSGSTTIPKGVMVSHGNLMYNLELIKKSFDHTAASQGVIWLPPYHDMGLIGGILQPFYSGFPVTLMSPVVFLQRPFRWLQAVSRFKATTSGGPNFAYELCVRKITPEQRSTLDLSSWDLAFNGAEPINYETLVRFAEYFKPCGFRMEAFYPCYGLAETTLIASGGLKSEPPRALDFQPGALEQNKAIITAKAGGPARTITGCGRTMPGQKILIVDPDALRTCAPGEIGEIWVAGPSVAQGYWRREHETNYSFGARLADTGEGPFLRTGDLGFLYEGELYVTGRLKDLIIIDGSNHYPQDIEWSVEQSHEALRTGCCAAFSVSAPGGEQLVVAVEIEPQYRLQSPPPDNNIPPAPGQGPNHRQHPDIKNLGVAIRRAVSEQHDLRVSHILLLKAGKIPKSANGKLQRYVCKAQYLAGTLGALEV